ncbi:MAG TPA: hypothetical protein DET40_19650 [Lentisphaeria bacterium]|nr:MAG: hypothetical protein A2X45_11235 [Lentisphaerae bacterium GWF2_50_93]HCE45764.1 hypothetical protein [Lentisphaeria bacterium]
MICERQKEYKKIAGELKRRIVVGEFRPDEKLPTERGLAGLLDVSRVTIRSALQELEKDNLIRRRQGAGTFVSNSSDAGTGLDRNSICLIFRNVRQISISEDPYVSMLLDGLNRASGRLGFRLSIMPVDSKDSFLDCIRRHPGMAPSSKGIILGSDNNFPESFEWLTDRGYSVVAIGPPPAAGSASHSYVDIDNKAGGRMAAEHLLSLGRKKIMFFSGAGNESSGRDRLNGISTAFSDRGLRFDESYVKFLVPWSEDDGYRTTLEALKSKPDLDAIIIHGDVATLGVLRALREKGRRIPEDVSVVIYDDFPWMRKISSPALTMVHQPFDEMSESAAEMLMEGINSLNPAVRIKILQSSLIIRESCGARLSASPVSAVKNKRSTGK